MVWRINGVGSRDFALHSRAFVILDVLLTKDTQRGGRGKPTEYDNRNISKNMFRHLSEKTRIANLEMIDKYHLHLLTVDKDSIKYVPDIAVA